MFMTMSRNRIAGRRPGKAHPAGTGDHHPPVWAGRPPGAYPEGGGGSNGNLAILYLPVGKAHHRPLEAGDPKGHGDSVTGVNRGGPHRQRTG